MISRDALRLRRSLWRIGVSIVVVTGVSTGSALAQEGAVPVPVDINEYFVEGNTLLSDAEIERAVYPYLGPDRSLDDVERARAALQSVYEGRGLKTVFVEVPQQDVVGGRVRLAVTEARIGQVSVTGARFVSERRLEASLPSIAEGRVPNLDRFSEELAALNGRSADRQITPQLSAGATPGAVDVALTVEEVAPLHAGLEFNNQYSRDTTKTRMQASLRYDDLWQRGHSLAAFYAVAPERRSDSEVVVLAYGAPFTERLRLDVTGLVSNSEVGTVANTNVLGDGQSVTATLTRTLGGPNSLYHRVTASVAYKDFEENVTFGAITDRAPIRYAPISLGYAGTVLREGGELGFNTALTFAFRGLGSNTEDFAYKRFLATGGFTYLRAGANVRQDLPGGSELFLSIDGQIASEPLVSNEQFSIGGAGSVRGYLQSESIGDNALASSVEWRSPVITPGFLEELRGIVFFDSARTWINKPLPEQEDSVGLMSIGVGLRVRLLDGVTGDLDLAAPLKNTNTTETGDVRLHVRVSADF